MKNKLIIIKSNSKSMKGRALQVKSQVKSITDYLLDQKTGLYREEYFKKCLCLERKRTERSKKPFLLILLNIMKILQDGKDIARKISQTLFSVTRETDIKGWFQYDCVIGIICTEINGYDKNEIKQKIVNSLVDLLTEEQINQIDITCHIFPEEYGDQEKGKSPDLNFYPDILKNNSFRKFSLNIKRAIDIVGSIMALIIVSPLFLVVSLMIKLSSKGEILFKQERIGQYGGKFTFLKFRTMYTNNDSTIHKEYLKKLITEKKSYCVEKSNAEEKCIYKIEDDPRVTPIGRFLRKMSIDEIPQFINVLKGEMSLVGPRPPIPYELENYETWHRHRILEIKPGMTGLWQVTGRSRTTFDEMVRLDLQYTREWSLWLDIKILLQTPWVILNGKGAY